MFYYIIFISALMLLLFYIILNKIKKTRQPSILDYPKRKGTVGLLLYTTFKDDIYILLGRESAHADSVKAFQFCEFGGATVKNQTYLENILRESYEESCGLVNLTNHDILNDGIIFYLNCNNRDIFYVLLEHHDRVNNFEFLEKRATFTDDKYLEKDQIQWVRLKDLLFYKEYNEEGFCVFNIEGQQLRIKIRPYFWHDCLKNIQNFPSFKKQAGN